MALLSTADILRCIFSLTIAQKDRRTYKYIRLTCKRFKTVIDALNIHNLLLSRKRNGMLRSMYTLANATTLTSIVHAPKGVFRAWFLIKPKKRLQDIQERLFRHPIFYADPTSKLFRYYVRLFNTTENAREWNNRKLPGCRIEYPNSTSDHSNQLLELFKFYLGSDEEVRVACKKAVISLLSKRLRLQYSSPLCRELFALIGSLLPFTGEELTLKVDLEKHAFLEIQTYQGCEDEHLEAAILETEEEEDERLYLDERDIVFRFRDPEEDERNKDPQYWSRASLGTWIKRVCVV